LNGLGLSVRPEYWSHRQVVSAQRTKRSRIDPDPCAQGFGACPQPLHGTLGKWMRLSHWPVPSLRLTLELAQVTSRVHLSSGLLVVIRAIKETECIGNSAERPSFC